MVDINKITYLGKEGTKILVNKIKENTSAISSETTRATAAEKANASAINSLKTSTETTANTTNAELAKKVNTSDIVEYTAADVEALFA